MGGSGIGWVVDARGVVGEVGARNLQRRVPVGVDGSAQVVEPPGGLDEGLQSGGQPVGAGLPRRIAPLGSADERRGLATECLDDSGSPLANDSPGGAWTSVFFWFSPDVKKMTSKNQ